MAIFDVFMTEFFFNPFLSVFLILISKVNNFLTEEEIKATTISSPIILSEIILILWKNDYKISEIKSTFKNRTRGESSVNIKLIFESLIGLCKLYLLKKSTKI